MIADLDGIGAFEQRKAVDPALVVDEHRERAAGKDRRPFDLQVDDLLLLDVKRKFEP